MHMDMILIDTDRYQKPHIVQNWLFNKKKSFENFMFTYITAYF